ncbi:MAG: DUF2946 family protein [Thermoguttaceae bacterium]
MRIFVENRRLSWLVAAGYALALLTAALVHNHGGPGDSCCGEPHDCHTLADNASHKDDQHGSSPKCPDRHPAPDNHCPACQFLAHNLALTAVVAASTCSPFVGDVVAFVPSTVSHDVFSAWQSRAPPAFA